RVMGLSYGDADKLAKMIPNELNIELADALKKSPDLKAAYDNDDTAKQVLDTAMAVEGLTRQVGVHAAGVVIADGALTDNVPLTRDDSGGVVTQWSMEHLSEVGMLKMDFLGLKTLTVIDDCLKTIKQTTGKEFVPADIPLDDAKTYELIASAQNVGVFQLESKGMGEACASVKPKCIEDIIALVALYRPGPMENIPVYGDRKQGRVPVEYPHPLLEASLKETYGIIIYQEQVMQAANILAGYSLGQADLLRRAMGKKKLEEMVKQRALFVEGCAKTNQIDEATANTLFDTLEKFAGYGFNKAHAACYGVLAYHTAWLKANYPVEFLAALMSNELGKNEKIAEFVAETKRMGYDVLPPDINKSFGPFTVEIPEGKKKKAIRYGMAGVKNVGSGAIEQIVAARTKDGPFQDLNDLCHRVEPNLLNKRLMESLVRVGAFDSFGKNRATTEAMLDGALGAAGSAAKEKASGQISLLDMLDEAPALDAASAGRGVQDRPEWGSDDLLSYEKELLGHYFSGHPLDKHLARLRPFQTTTVDKLATLDEGTPVRVAGMITKFEVKISKKTGNNLPIVTFEDQTGKIEFMLMGGLYEKMDKPPAAKDLVVFTANVTFRGEDVSLRVQDYYSLDEAESKLLKGLTIDIDLDGWDLVKWDSLHQLILDHPGPARLYFRCTRGENGHRRTTVLEPSDLFTVAARHEFMEGLRTLLGGPRYEIVPSRDLPRARKPFVRRPEGGS
ncbi:MAG TPA: DNA polymerase III subunit alpha, partial [Candidatus Methylacidiphilales bacterium]